MKSFVDPLEKIELVEITITTTKRRVHLEIERPKDVSLETEDPRETHMLAESFIPSPEPLPYEYVRVQATAPEYVRQEHTLLDPEPEVYELHEPEIFEDEDETDEDA